MKETGAGARASTGPSHRPPTPWRLAHPVGENEPITESKLAPVEAGAGLPPAIQRGMRAMSVKINDVIGVAGFVVPGARVDVLVTIHDEAAG